LALLGRALGLILNVYRYRLNWTQDQVGAGLNIGREHISRYERGAASPTISTLTRYAEVLCVPIWRLLLDAEWLAQAMAVAPRDAERR
jgi:transcriptional regulator with XRE-family HTH domain